MSVLCRLKRSRPSHVSSLAPLPHHWPMSCNHEPRDTGHKQQACLGSQTGQSRWKRCHEQDACTACHWARGCSSRQHTVTAGTLQVSLQPCLPRNLPALSPTHSIYVQAVAMSKRHAQEEVQEAMLKMRQVEAQLHEAQLRAQQAEEQVQGSSSTHQALADAQVRYDEPGLVLRARVTLSIVGTVALRDAEPSWVTPNILKFCMSRHTIACPGSCSLP